MRIHSFLYVTFLIFLCFLNSYSLEAKPHGSLFDNYSLGNGLSDKTIHCIFQDSKGWVWIGTDFGVLRFDGYTFRNFRFNSNESEILSNTLIRTFFEDKEGVIWIGTENYGVFRYDRNVYGIEQINTKLFSNKTIWSIAEAEDGYLLFGTEKGIHYYNKETNSVDFIINADQTPEILKNDFIRKLFIDKEQRIWVGTDEGISILNKNKTLYKNLLVGRELDDVLENQVWEIFQDSKADMWIGTYLGGLLKYSKKEGKLETVLLDKINNRAITVRAVVEDKQGNIWIGTRGGLYSIERNSNEITKYQENVLDDHSLVHNSVLNLLVDAKGDLWIGTRNGISFLNFERQAFSYLNSYSCGSSNLNNSEVYALWEDEEKNIWIGTESGGINIFNRVNNSVSLLTTENKLSNNCVKAISPGLNGNVLIGTYLGGLNQYNPKTGRNKVYMHDENNPKSISDNSVWAIYTDSKGRTWIGTNAGLDIFNEIDGSFTHLGEKYGVTNVNGIYEDYGKRIWISDLRKLIMISPGGVIRHFPFKARSFSSDENGYLWFGTIGSGLVRYDPLKNKVVSYTVNDGLCSDVIYSMINVDNNFLWLSTNNGLSRFDIEQEVFRNYYVSDGLLNNQFNYGASFECSENTLVFGGKKGVDIVHLSELHENEYIPPVVLTDFKIFNKEVPIMLDSGNSAILKNLICESKEVTLSYDQNMISFGFAALNYANSGKNTYKYKLEGFDKDWNDIGSNHKATYTNLDYGEYTFKVIGANSDNKYNEEGLSFDLNILPPFWKTWYFRSIIIGLIGFILYWIYVFIINREKLKNQLVFERNNTRQMQELERLKHQFFMNISHEIRTPLSLIVGPLDKMLTDRSMGIDEIISHLGIIKRNTSVLNKLVSQLLDYRKLETGNLKLELKQGNLNVFLKDLMPPFKQLAEDRKIDLDYNISQRSLFFAFDSDKLEKIIYNLLSNAIKYTNPNGKISISVSTTFIDELENTNNYLPKIDLDNDKVQQFVKITIRDTGVGIPSNQILKIFDRFKQIDNALRKSSSGTGIGLSLTKELVKLHNGHIKVRSVEGKGSKFTLLLPYIDDKSYDAQEAAEIDVNPDMNTYQKEIAEENLHNKNIPILLIIDDNPDIRKFVKHHFESEYKVYTAKDGKEGWDNALELVPDLIITDVMMPNSDGVELCRKIKNDERTSHIPVLLLTALTAKEKQLEGISAGADDYIVKPFDVALLKAKADNLLYIRKALRERFSKEMFLKPKDIVLTSPDEKFLRKVIQVIEKNISEPNLDVDFLAKHVGVSRTQLYRKINALTDMAAKEFVKDLRLKRATQMLTQNKLNISEVAFAIGFNDISYFRKCFKDKYGVSASKYVRNVK